MQPEPSLYLRAIRRELLSPELFGGGLASGASPVVTSRAGSCLGQLTLRSEFLPQQLAQLRPRYVALLQRVATMLEHRGVAAPVRSIPALIRASEVEASDADEIRLFDQVSEALSEGLRLLSAQGFSRTDLDEITEAACLLEHRRRQAYNQALAAFEASEAAVKAATALPPVSPAELTEHLRASFPKSPDITATEVHRLSGFNSKDIFFVEISGHLGWPGASVLRREPAFNVTGAALVREWRLLDYLRAHGVPVPRVLLASSGRENGGGFIIMERLPGKTRDAHSLGADGRSLLLDAARIAAKFHQIPALGAFPSSEQGPAPHERMWALVEDHYRRWTEGRAEDSLVLQAAYIWLRENLWRLSDQTALVHGDFNLRNILLDGDKISAVLDWELWHLGDPAEDLAYIRPDVERLMDWEEFLEEYLAHSPFFISSDALQYFRVYTNFWRAAIAALAYSGYAHRAHDNFIFASTAFAEYRLHSDDIVAAIANLSA
jgi:aminoglycoside phosphotransferase (APT) family kinase protein